MLFKFMLFYILQLDILNRGLFL